MPSLADILKDIQAKEGPSKEDRFYLEFGQFICTFADVEAACYVLIRKLLRVGDQKSRAVIGTQNLGQLISTIKRLISISDVSKKKKAELDYLLTQLEAISKFRGDLVHRGARVSDRGIVSDNFFTAKTYDTVEEVIFQIEHIQSATMDIRSIYVRLSQVFLKKGQKRFSRRDLPSIYGPWRYKRLQPKNPLKQTQQKTPRLFPPPGAFEA